MGLTRCASWMRLDKAARSLRAASRSSRRAASSASTSAVWGAWASASSPASARASPISHLPKRLSPVSLSETGLDLSLLNWPIFPHTMAYRLTVSPG